MSVGISNLINAAGTLPAGRFTFEQLDKITSGKHNLGLLKLDGSGQLVKFNNHVWKTDKNNVNDVAAENIAVRNAVFNSIAAHYEKETGKEFKSCLEAVRENLLGDKRMDLPLSRKEVRAMLNQFKALAAESARTAEMKDLSSTIQKLGDRISDLEMMKKGTDVAIEETGKNASLFKKCVSGEGDIRKLEKEKSGILQTCSPGDVKTLKDLLQRQADVQKRLGDLKDLCERYNAYGDSQYVNKHQGDYRRLLTPDRRRNESFFENYEGENAEPLSAFRHWLLREAFTDHEFPKTADEKAKKPKAGEAADDENTLNVDAKFQKWKAGAGKDECGKLALDERMVAELENSVKWRVFEELQKIEGERPKLYNEKDAEFEDRMAKLDKREAKAHKLLTELLSDARNAAAAELKTVQGTIKAKGKETPALAKLAKLEAKIQAAREKMPAAPPNVMRAARLKNLMNEMSAFASKHGKALVKGWMDLMDGYDASQRAIEVPILLNSARGAIAAADLENFARKNAEVAHLMNGNPVFKEFCALRQELLAARIGAVDGTDDPHSQSSSVVLFRSFLETFDDKGTLGKWDEEIRKLETAQQNLAAARQNLATAQQKLKSNPKSETVRQGVQAAEQAVRAAEQVVRTSEQALTTLGTANADFNKFRVLRQNALNSKFRTIDDAAVAKALDAFDSKTVSRLKREKSSLASEIKVLEKQKDKAESRLEAAQTRTTDALRLNDFLNTIQKLQPSGHRKDFLLDLMARYGSYESCQPLIAKLRVMLQRDDTLDVSYLGKSVRDLPVTAFSEKPFGDEFRNKVTELMETLSKEVDGGVARFRHLTNLDAELETASRRLEGQKARLVEAQNNLKKAKADLSAAEKTMSACVKAYEKSQKDKEPAKLQGDKLTARTKAIESVRILKTKLEEQNKVVADCKKTVSELTAYCKQCQIDPERRAELAAKAAEDKWNGLEKAKVLEKELVEIARKDSPGLDWRLQFDELVTRYASDRYCAAYLEEVASVIKSTLSQDKVPNQAVIDKTKQLFETLVASRPTLVDDLNEMLDMTGGKWSHSANKLLDELKGLCKALPESANPVLFGDKAVAGNELHALSRRLGAALKDTMLTYAKEFMNAAFKQKPGAPKTLNRRQVKELERDFQLLPMIVIGQTLPGILVDPKQIGAISDLTFAQRIGADTSEATNLLVKQLKLANEELDRIAEKVKTGGVGLKTQTVPDEKHPGYAKKKIEGRGARVESDYHTYLKKVAEIFSKPVSGLSFYGEKVREQIAAAFLALVEDVNLKKELDTLLKPAFENVEMLRKEAEKLPPEKIEGPTEGQKVEFTNATIGAEDVENLMRELEHEHLLDTDNPKDKSNAGDVKKAEDMMKQHPGWNIASAVFQNAADGVRNAESPDISDGITSLVKFAKEGGKVLTRTLAGNPKADQVAQFAAAFERECVTPIERQCCALLGIGGIQDFPDKTLQPALEKVRSCLKDIAQDPGKAEDLKTAYAALQQALERSRPAMQKRVGGEYLATVTLGLMDRLAKARDGFHSLVSLSGKIQETLVGKLDGTKSQRPHRFAKLFEREFVSVIEQRCCALLGLEDFSNFPDESVRSAVADVRSVLDKLGRARGPLSAQLKAELKAACDNLQGRLAAADKDMGALIGNDLKIIVDSTKARLTGDSGFDKYNAQLVVPASPANVTVEVPGTITDLSGVMGTLDNLETKCLGGTPPPSNFLKHVFVSSSDTVWNAENVDSVSSTGLLAKQLVRVRSELNSLPGHLSQKLNFKAPDTSLLMPNVVSLDDATAPDEWLSPSRTEQPSLYSALPEMTTKVDVQVGPTVTDKEAEEIGKNLDTYGTDNKELLNSKGPCPAGEPDVRTDYKAVDAARKAIQKNDVKSSDLNKLRETLGRTYLALRDADEVRKVVGLVAQYEKTNVGKSADASVNNSVAKALADVKKAIENFNAKHNTPGVRQSELMELHGTVLTAYSALRDAEAVRQADLFVTEIENRHGKELDNLAAPANAQLFGSAEGPKIKAALDAYRLARSEYLRESVDDDADPERVDELRQDVLAAYEKLKTALLDEDERRVVDSMKKFETDYSEQLKSADYSAVKSALEAVKTAKSELASARNNPEKAGSVEGKRKALLEAYATLQKSPYVAEVGNIGSKVKQIENGHSALLKSDMFATAPDADVRKCMSVIKSLLADFDAECAKPNFDPVRLVTLRKEIRTAYSNLQNSFDLALRDEEVRQADLFVTLAERRLVEALDLGNPKEIPDGNIRTAIDQVRSAVKAYKAHIDQRGLPNAGKTTDELFAAVHKADSDMRKTLGEAVKSVDAEIANVIDTMTLTRMDEEVDLVRGFAAQLTQSLSESKNLGGDISLARANIKSAIERYDTERKKTISLSRHELEARFKSVCEAYSKLRKALAETAETSNEPVANVILSATKDAPRLSEKTEYPHQDLDMDLKARNRIDDLLAVRNKLDGLENQVLNDKVGENYSPLFRDVFHTVANSAWNLKNINLESCEILLMDQHWGNKNIKKVKESLHDLQGSRSELDQAYETNDWPAIENILQRLQDLSNAFGHVQFRFGTMDGEMFRQNLAQAWERYYNIEDNMAQSEDYLVLHQALTAILDSIEGKTP